MPFALTKVERDVKREEAYALSLKGEKNLDIARALDVHYNTVTSLIREAQRLRRAEAEKRGDDPKERFVVEQRMVMAEHWKYIEVSGVKEAHLVADMLGLTEQTRAQFMEYWKYKVAPSIGGVNVPAHLAGIASCSERIARAMGVFVDRHEHTGRGGGPIETRVKHEFDFDSFEGLFAEAVGASSQPSPETDGR